MKTVLRNVLFLLLAAASFLPQRVLAANGANCAAAGGFCAYPTLYERSGILLQANDCSVDTYACFKNGTPQTPATSASGSSGTANSGASQVNTPDRLVLPACTKTGDCSLDDIVATGVNFATFLMGLSGALFFAVFIYGGAMYLASFGDAKRVAKGKSAIIGAVIGMIFVLGAWTIVNTLTKGLTGQSTGAADQCAAQGAGFSCVTLSGSTGQAAMADGDSKGYSCRTGLCPGTPVNVLCCALK